MAEAKSPTGRFPRPFGWAASLLAACLAAGAAEEDPSASGARRPLLEIRQDEGEGWALLLHMAPYNGQHAKVVLPEAMYVIYWEEDALQTCEFNQMRKHVPPFRHEDRWWLNAEDNGKAAYSIRGRVGGDDGERLEVEYMAYNRGDVPWQAAWFRTCVRPPEAFRDPKLKRTYVVDTYGQLRCLADLTHHPLNFISMRRNKRPTAMRLPPSLWATSWRYPDLRLAETVIMVESKDGRYTLSTASARAYGLTTGFLGPCIHSDPMTGAIPPGRCLSVRGYVALTPGDARAALEYYFSVKQLMHAP